MERGGGNSASSPSAAAAAFVLGSPPLAALHSMTEMKSAMLQHYSNTPTSAAQNLKNHHGLPPHVSQEKGPDRSLQGQPFFIPFSAFFQSMHSPPISTTTTISNSTNPHGIDHILSRSSTSQLGAAVAAASAVMNASAAAAGAAAGLARLPHGMGMSMSHMAGTAWMGAIGKQLELARPAIYWPGLQGLVGNPNLWRDRGNNHSGEQKLL